MRPPIHALFGASHELPTALGQKAVVAAGDHLRAILESHEISGLDHAPVRKHLGPDIATVPARSDGTVYVIANAEILYRTRPPVRHQNRRLWLHAVNTSVLAPPIRIDRPLKRNVRRVVGRDDPASPIRGDRGGNG